MQQLAKRIKFRQKWTEKKEICMRCWSHVGAAVTFLWKLKDNERSSSQQQSPPPPPKMWGPWKICSSWRCAAASNVFTIQWLLAVATTHRGGIWTRRARFGLIFFALTVLHISVRCLLYCFFSCSLSMCCLSSVLCRKFHLFVRSFVRWVDTLYYDAHYFRTCTHQSSCVSYEDQSCCDNSKVARRTPHRS